MIFNFQGTLGSAECGLWPVQGSLLQDFTLCNHKIWEQILFCFKCQLQYLARARVSSREQKSWSSIFSWIRCFSKQEVTSSLSTCSTLKYFHVWIWPRCKIWQLSSCILIKTADLGLGKQLSKLNSRHSLPECRKWLGSWKWGNLRVWLMWQLFNLCQGSICRDSLAISLCVPRAPALAWPAGSPAPIPAPQRAMTIPRCPPGGMRSLLPRSSLQRAEGIMSCVWAMHLAEGASWHGNAPRAEI